MAYATPTFYDDFVAADPLRWIVPQESNWPPKPGTPGKWARTFLTGWPWRTDGDKSARNFEANHEAQCYEDSGVALTPNGLTLTATKGVFNHFGMPWASGCITQNRDLALQYGYFECVAQAPSGKGFWPAFWLLPTALNWSAETDVFEMLCDQLRQVHSGVTGQDSGAWSKSTWLDMPFDISEGLHKYGLLWTKDKMTWFADDVQTYTIDTPDNFHQPMYLIANLAVGGAGSWPGEPTSDGPAVLTIQRIAAYALGSWGDTAVPSTPPVGTASPVPTPVPTPLPTPAPVPFNLSPVEVGVWTAASDVLVINMAQDAWNGNAQFSISIDGAQVGPVLSTFAANASKETQAFVIKGAFGKAEHRVSIDFRNDAYGGPGKDRNLYVVSASINDVPVPKATLAMFSGGAQSFKFKAA